MTRPYRRRVDQSSASPAPLSPTDEVVMGVTATLRRIDSLWRTKGCLDIPGKTTTFLWPSAGMLSALVMFLFKERKEIKPNARNPAAKSAVVEQMFGYVFSASSSSGTILVLQDILMEEGSAILSCDPEEVGIQWAVECLGRDAPNLLRSSVKSLATLESTLRG